MTDDAFEKALGFERARLDREIAQAGSVGRVRRHLLSRRLADPLGGIAWGRVAAAMLVAGMLGGSVDLLLFGGDAETTEVAIFDPSLEDIGPQ
jgi:hypothetical protein